MRLALFTLAWLACNLVIAGCVVGLGAILIFYTAIGPFACVYVGARVGSWCGFDLCLTSGLMIAGLWFFGTIRLRLYRRILRLWRKAHRTLQSASALRNDIWRQYRLSSLGQNP